jgi:hypothetical protein
MSDMDRIGKDLLEHARLEAHCTARRGLVDELFPYIWLASKKMSLRAIRSWLASERKIELSIATLSRAMRARDEHWQALYDLAEPAAFTIGRDSDMPPWRVLRLSEDEFKALEEGGGVLSEEWTPLNEDAEQHQRELFEAAATLGREWFCLPREAREECLSRIAVLMKADEHADEASEPEAATDEEG